MDVLDAVMKECEEKVQQLRGYLSAGSAKNYEEYQKLCGQISGLLYAKDYALSLKQQWESSDD